MVDLTRTLPGLGEAEARARARAAGHTMRVVERDGKPLVVTADRRPGRINVRIAGGKVVSADLY